MDIIEEIKDYMQVLQSHAGERYQENKKLFGVNSYVSGYEFGYIEALEEILEYIIAEERRHNGKKN